MLSTRIKKIKNAIIYFITGIIIFIIKLKPVSKKENTLLLIRLDAIGDYILFRNFLESVRKSKKYSGYKITLCGNIIWKSLSESFDAQFVDDFIWVDRKKFYFNFIHKYKFLKAIYKRGFETVVETTHSREILFGDTIVNAAHAVNSIGSIGSGEEFTAWKRKLLTNKLYTELIEISNQNLFEFEINKELFRKLLSEKLEITKQSLDASSINRTGLVKKNYVLLFPGSSDPARMWAANNFKDVAEYIISNYDYDIIITGSKSESHLFEKIICKDSEKRFINLFGNSLPELAKSVSEAKLLISNDTSAVHFAAATGTPFICISNGSYFGRFNPYPAGTVSNSIHLYPESFLVKMNDIDSLHLKYRYGTDIDINEIKPQVVIEEIKKILTAG